MSWWKDSSWITFGSDVFSRLTFGSVRTGWFDPEFNELFSLSGNKSRSYWLRLRLFYAFNSDIICFIWGCRGDRKFGGALTTPTAPSMEPPLTSPKYTTPSPSKKKVTTLHKKQSFLLNSWLIQDKILSHRIIKETYANVTWRLFCNWWVILYDF